MDKVIITDLETSGIIGVKHPERDHPQTILVNLELFVDLGLAGETDSITDTINYSTISKFILAEVAAVQFYTVEALATHLAKQILRNFAVKKARVRIEKPKRVSQTDRVGVEIKRSRKDFDL